MCTYSLGYKRAIIVTHDSLKKQEEMSKEHVEFLPLLHEKSNYKFDPLPPPSKSNFHLV